MQSAVTTGARVQLTSGLFGTIIDGSNKDFVDVEIATGIVTRWNRLAIMRVVPVDEAADTYPGALAEPLDADDDAIEPAAETDVDTTADRPTDNNEK